MGEEETSAVAISWRNLNTQDTQILVGENFCRAYSNLTGESATLVAVEQDGVDAILNIDGATVCVEMTQYLQQDRYLECGQNDADLKEYVTKYLSKNRFVHLVQFDYRTEQRKKVGDFFDKETFCIRRLSNDAIKKIREELNTLIELVYNSKNFDRTDFRFRSSATKMPRSGYGNCQFLLANDYPSLSNSCASVTIQLDPDIDMLPTIRSSFDSRAMAFDFEQAGRVVKQKIQRLPKYRNSANGRPVWLLVHANGYPTSARVLPPLRRDLIAVVSKECGSNTSSFDNVWVGFDMFFDSHARIEKIA